eukprot:Plantae.Rhodophyta-Palmaria_palmata.ctg29932.p1 GENE.Plantae.Rhodophyta-Palmaria_palmata.ctg29932~~Plantae.Rhodophyta-Palmaria_palmata.ctg29932.p1  ORF type:complete len:132 (+),score=14.11 Plantae.Rhodophyta-Palmaria_palmata.ctg29932:64-459(+)
MVRLFGRNLCFSARALPDPSCHLKTGAELVGRAGMSRIPTLPHRGGKSLEWHLPATMAVDAKGPGVATLVKIDSLPEWAQGSFAHTKDLNEVQSRIDPCAFSSVENMLLYAPTGAGKTNVAMLTILQAVAN